MRSPNGTQIMEDSEKDTRTTTEKLHERKYDQTGSLVYPSERHVIKKYMNSQGKIVRIYDTDEVRILNKVWNDYFMESNIWDMEDIIKEGKVPKEKNMQKNF